MKVLSRLVLMIFKVSIDLFISSSILICIASDMGDGDAAAPDE